MSRASTHTKGLGGKLNLRQNLCGCVLHYLSLPKKKKKAGRKCSLVIVCHNPLLPSCCPPRGHLVCSTRGCRKAMVGSETRQIQALGHAGRDHLWKNLLRQGEKRALQLLASTGPHRCPWTGHAGCTKGQPHRGALEEAWRLLEVSEHCRGQRLSPKGPANISLGSGPTAPAEAHPQAGVQLPDLQPLIPAAYSFFLLPIQEMGCFHI